jgi:hypothetical protein
MAPGNHVGSALVGATGEGRPQLHAIVHTPGPWEPQYRHDGVPFGVGAPESMVDDADILCVMPYPRWRHDGRIDELKANARLIAASPKMLAALKMVLQHGRIDDSESRIRQVAEAITAAESVV